MQTYSLRVTKTLIKRCGYTAYFEYLSGAHIRRYVSVTFWLKYSKCFVSATHDNVNVLRLRTIVRTYNMWTT